MTLSTLLLSLVALPWCRVNAAPSGLRFWNGPTEERVTMTWVQEQDIIDGNYLLIRLNVTDEAYLDPTSDYRGQVFGVFCRVDLSAQKEDPSRTPFFMNAVREAQCGKPGNRVQLDFYDIVQKTKKYDEKQRQTLGSTTKSARSILPTAFFYHEGRCGSTLVSNSAAVLAPERTRVYSEPLPPMQALLDCDKTRVNCNHGKAVNLFRDVVYMMGRTSNLVEDRMFFKLLPSSILAARIINEAYPDVPWAFIFRDPIHVMVSNLKDSNGDNAPGPYCMNEQGFSEQSEYTALVVAKSGKEVKNLSKEEFCAAYLVSF